VETAGGRGGVALTVATEVKLVMMVTATGDGGRRSDDGGRSCRPVKGQ
jgi:hypothetical protein